MIYESDPNRLPDSEFVPGTIHYLVAGNEGRLLDPMRTPVKVVAVKEATGHLVVEVTTFEDAGAHWEIPLEEASRLQFHRDSDELSPSQLSVYSAIARPFDQPLHIECSADQRDETEQRIADTRREVGRWLATKSEFVQSEAALTFNSRDGVQSLYRDCGSLMAWRGLSRVESLFAEKYVRGGARKVLSSDLIPRPAYCASAALQSTSLAKGLVFGSATSRWTLPVR